MVLVGAGISVDRKAMLQQWRVRFFVSIMLEFIAIMALSRLLWYATWYSNACNECHFPTVLLYDQSEGLLSASYMWEKYLMTIGRPILCGLTSRWEWPNIDICLPVVLYVTLESTTSVDVAVFALTEGPTFFLPKRYCREYNSEGRKDVLAHWLKNDSSSIIDACEIIMSSTLSIQIYDHQSH